MKMAGVLDATALNQIQGLPGVPVAGERLFLAEEFPQPWFIDHDGAALAADHSLSG